LLATKTCQTTQHQKKKGFNKLNLCDNQVLLKAVKRCVAEGGKATLGGAPDANILLEAIEELQKKTTAGAVTFVVKVNAH